MFSTKCIARVSTYLKTEADTHEMHRQKEVMVLYHAVTLVVTIAATVRLPLALGSGNTVLINDVNGLVGVMLSLGGLLYILMTKSAPRLLLEGILYCWALLFLSTDLTALATGRGTRGWPLFVVLLDVVLLCDVPGRVSKNLICLLTVWLIVTAIESTARLGFYDIPALEDHATRRSYAHCQEPPCGQPLITSILELLSQLGVFMLDFKLTRGFAHGMRHEHNRMTHAIATAEKIANTLSHFDLQAAEECLADPVLPPDLSSAFKSILNNLHQYRPYLPQSFLQDSTPELSNLEAGSHFAASEDKEFKEHVGPRPPTPLSCLSDLDYAPPNPLFSTVERRRASFVVMNMHESHSRVLQDAREYGVEYKEYIEAILRSFATHRGVVSLVVGDHVHGAFNTTKKCTGHCMGAVAAAGELLTSLQSVNVGVSSGEVHSGPFGCNELMSLLSLGQAVVLASYAESYGRANELPLVCTATVQIEVGHLVMCKLVLLPICYKTSTVHTHLYEVLYQHKAQISMDTSVSLEWMYEIQENPWALYNEAGKRYLQGETQEALRLLGICTLNKHTEELKSLILTGRVPVPIRMGQ
eukprot:TRINITY_DN1652_c0_g1_i1.p1 TRINITY_DN1652_c0_g1~~TRINITY_DN1652_c0_g1_i1.p1  ORF type:complete len:585 (+),score=80.80 TRINITY_DN1652_c0_g1_i1:526-2280(+)